MIDQDQNKLLSRVLLLGVLLSVGLMSLGLSIYFFGYDSLVINLGILMLIATPILRVLAALATFAINGEKFYVFISTLVFSILLVSFLIA
ncbi:MAG: DUF1634 domain-containing protein [Methanocellales archaeon]